MTINLDTVHLATGAHADPEQGMCIMELVSILAGQPFTDAPPCVSPVLRSFALRWNDDLDDTTRQRLIPYAPRMVGTAGDGHDERRVWLLVDWQVRTFTPAFLRLAGLTIEADRLTNAAVIVDHESLTAVQADLDQARTKAAAARDAAWDAAGAAAWAAAGAAAGAAAWDAARDAARDAAGAAAWDAAGAAAWDAAWAAAWDAAWAAAWDAAWAAAWDRLASTVAELQESAFDLLDRLIDPTRERVTR